MKYDLDNIKNNHFKHVDDRFKELELEFKEEIGKVRIEFNKEIGKVHGDLRELKGSFDIIKPVGITIAGGVVLAVIKYLFFP